MKEQTFILQRAAERNLTRLVAFIAALPRDRAWKLTITEWKRTRSTDQNAYLWGVVYTKILEHPELDGWTDKDIHEFMLGEHFGWQELKATRIIPRRKIVPKRRSSKLSTVEFMDYIAFIQRYWAEYGVYIPDPNEEVSHAA